MTVRTDDLVSLSSPFRSRNATPRAFPALAGSRGPSGGAGISLVALVWMAALAFFVLGIAAPAAVMERRTEEVRVARALAGSPEAPSLAP